jgi:hypothetical protein
MGIICYMVRPNGALHVLASVNNGASLKDGNSVTLAQGLIRTAPSADGYRGGQPRS